MPIYTYCVPASRVAHPGYDSQSYVAMTNVFDTSLLMHKKYDLKGSTHGRAVTEKEKESHDIILKDRDIQDSDIRLYLRPDQREDFLSRIARDAEWLRKHEIMDYSLLLGVHYTKHQVKSMAKYQVGVPFIDFL